MSAKRNELAATLDRLYPPVIGGPGWDDVLERLDAPRAAPTRRRLIGPLAATLAIVVVAAPAFAFSPKVRGLVGLASTPHAHRVVVARLTGVVVHKPYPKTGLSSVTVTFTVGEAGKPPGPAVPRGSALFVVLLGKHGTKSPLTRAHGAHGRYRATTLLPPGGIANIWVGGWLNTRPGLPPGNLGFWIPVTGIDIPD
ncbi:MAG TPA: hypothetical protein VNR59_10395 [Gaiellaceae bacterium]|nr:hypothetical protein [Gaiellaceae bacterium]